MMYIPCLEKLVSFFGATLILVILCSTGAASQELLRGTLNARNHAPLDRGTPLSIHFRNDSEMNERLAPVAKRALMERRFVVTEGAPLELMIETEIGESSVPQHDVQITGEGGSGGKSSKTFGIQRRITGATRKPTLNRAQYRLTMTLSRDGSAQIWWGSVEAIVDKPNREAAFSALIERLVREIGKTVENRRIEED